MLFLSEDQRVAHLQHGEGKGQQPSSKQVCSDERDGDFSKRPQGWTTEVLGGLLERDTRLLETCGGGPDNIRQAPHRVGNHKDQQGIDGRIEEFKDLPLLSHREITEGEHQPRNGKRHHRERVEDLPTRETRANHHIGNSHSQDDIEQGRKARVFEAVLDRREREVVAERRLEVRKSPTTRQDGLIPLTGKRHEHHSEVG